MVYFGQTISRWAGAILGVLFAIISAIGYSSNYIMIQIGMRRSKDDNGDFLSLFSAVVTVALLFSVLMMFSDRELNELNWLGILFFIFAGFCTAFLGRILLFSGIRKIGSSRAAAIKNTAPIFTVLIAVLLLGETISPIAGIGMLLIFAALFWQAKHDFKRPMVTEQSDNKGGFILSFIAAICFGVGQIARKQGMMYYEEPLIGSLIGSLFALIIFILIKVAKKDLVPTLKKELRKPNLFFIGAGALTGIAQLSFFFSLLYTNVSYTSVVAAVEPIITVILSGLFLRKEENLTKRVWFTACIVFIGTVVIVLGK